MRRNILLFILVLVISYFVAPYFGLIYNMFAPQLGSSFLGVGKETAIYVAGIPFAYMFLIPLTFGLFGSGNRNKWIIWLVTPIILFYLYDNVRLTYLPIALALIAFGLAFIVRKIFKIS